jgi:hypothetical protein
MKPKWLQNVENYREKSDRRVAEIAKKTGGRVTPNSGATPFSKGDIWYTDKLLEHKQTSKASYKINKSDLEKIYRDATKVNKLPFFMIDFGDIIFTGEVSKNFK